MEEIEEDERKEGDVKGEEKVPKLVPILKKKVFTEEEEEKRQKELAIQKEIIEKTLKIDEILE